MPPRTTAAWPKGNASKAKQNIQMDVSHADVAEYGVARGTHISFSTFFRNKSRDEEIQATLTHEELN